MTRGRTRKAGGGKSIHLLGHLHRTQLRGEGRSRASRHDNRRHHGTHLTHHGDAHQIRHEDLGAELLELHGADKGENHSYQKTD
jgi:hypothetical protein